MRQLVHLALVTGLAVCVAACNGEDAADGGDSRESVFGNCDHGGGTATASGGDSTSDGQGPSGSTTSAGSGGGQSTAGAPYVDGNVLHHAGGSRLIFKAANIEFLRYVDSCTTSISQFEYDSRDQFAQTLHDLGLNGVRINIGASAFAEKPEYVGKLADMVASFAKNGIYSMVSDHNHTGTDLSDHASSFGNFSAVIDAVRNAGVEDYLLMDPYNEPGPTDWDTWASAMVDTIDQLRQSAGFHGVIVLDTIGWATGFDAATFDQMLSHDADLNSGKPNLVFSNHWYPNIPTSGTFAKMDNAANYALIVGEIGQINPGSSPLDPGYVAETLDHIVDVNLPQGHNGVFPWMWNWCDENSMSDDFFTYNSFGSLVDEHYYSKVPDNPAP